MSELMGINYLRSKLAVKEARSSKRYQYYEQKNTVQDFGISTPPKMRPVTAHLGWCTKAVDALADRLQFYQFENDAFDMNGIYQQNNADVLFDSAILSALITSCCFIYISEEDGFPRLQVIDGRNATGIMDPITGLLTEGYAILDTDANGKPILEAYFAPGYTDFIQYEEAGYRVENSARYPLLVPVVHRPDAKRPFGHSRITRACMDTEDDASRTIKRAETSAEFYSFPQKYVLGISPESEKVNSWKATMSAMMIFTKDEDGDKPTLGQFSQQSMGPHLDHVKALASIFAGETGLTLDDLGFQTDNPSSADAIKAAHENLRLAARKAQKCFGIGFLNAGYLAASVRDGVPYQRTAIYQTKPVWEPIFEPDAAMLSGIGDGAIKINQAIPGYFGTENLRKLTGIKADS